MHYSEAFKHIASENILGAEYRPQSEVATSRPYKMISFSAQLDNKNCPPGSVSEGMLGLCVTTRSLKPASQQLYLAEEIGSICV